MNLSHKSSNDFEKHEGVTIRRIGLPQHKSGMFDQSKAFLKYFVNVVRFIKGKDYDLVFATSSRLMTAFLGAYISKKIGKPLYLDIRDIFTDTMSNILTPKVGTLINPVLNFIEKKTFNRAVHINLVSEGFLQYFKEKYPMKKYSFYSNGIDEIFLKNQFRKINTVKDKLVILYAGNIGEGQGLHNFLPLFAKETNQNYHFKIIGDGGKRKSLEGNLKLLNTKNVEIIDPIERSELLEEYKNADILLLHLNNYSAFQKVLPSKIFEYGAMGKPIIAGVSGYSAEFLNKYVKNSVVFEPCNVEQAKKSLSSIDFMYTDRKSFIQRFSRTSIMNDMAVSILSVPNTNSIN